MRIKTYQAPDMLALLDKIRDDLGPLAVLLSVRRLPAPDGADGAPHMLEGTAAYDPEHTAAVAGNGKGAMPEASRITPEPRAARVQRERPGTSGSEGGAEFQVLGTRSTNGTRAMLMAGPSRSGKTTMAARIAAWLHAETGKPVGLISICRSNAGSTRALRDLSRALNLPWARARSASQLRTVVSRWDRRGWLVMDSEATRCADQQGVYGRLRDAGVEPETHLVLNANQPPESIAQQIHDFEPLISPHVALTRMDQDRYAAGTFAQILKARKKVSFLGTGPGVSDLEIASPCLENTR